jgi:hypothetical protein
MGTFFRSNPGLSSRIAHHIEFPDYSPDELASIARLMLERMQYRLSPEADLALREYIERRKERPHFANARSVRNALDRARLRQANRLLSNSDRRLISKDDLMTLEAADIRASRVFSDPPDPDTT